MCINNYYTQHVHLYPLIHYIRHTFITSTCRSSCRDGVTLTALSIWLSSCRSSESVSTDTNLSSARSFYSKTVAEKKCVSFEVTNFAHCATCHLNPNTVTNNIAEQCIYFPNNVKTYSYQVINEGLF